MFSMVFIETTTACNRRCSYCPNAVYDRGLIKNEKRMEPAVFHKTMDDLAAMRWQGTIALNFFSEPLLDDRLPQLIAYAHSKLPRCLIEIFTNGDLLSVDLFKKLVEAGTKRFNITQHSEKKQENVEGVIAYNNTLGKDAIDIYYHPLVEHVTNRGGVEALTKENMKLRKFCLWPSKSIGVGYNGNILFCCDDYFNTVKLGNITKEHILKIWKKPRYKQLRRETKKGIYTEEICKNCKIV